MYKIIKKNYYGLKLENIIQRYNLTRYVNNFCIKGEYYPYSVFYSENPNRAQDHRNYLLVGAISSRAESMSAVISGMDLEEILPFAVVDAMVCEKCKEVIYSCMRHDYVTCSCGNAMIDGGNDYVHCSMNEGNRLVKLNLITEEITEIVVPEKVTKKVTGYILAHKHTVSLLSTTIISCGHIQLEKPETYNSEMYQLVTCEVEVQTK